MSREHQDVQSFADGNLQHKIINRAINAIKKLITRQLYTRVVKLCLLLHRWSEFV